MRTARREFVKGVVASATVASLVSQTACERLISVVTNELGQTIPDKLTVSADREIDPAFHLLARAAFGPWPGDLARVQSVGEHAWIEEQLSPESIDDTACDLRARRFETIWHDPGTCYEYKKPVLREELTRHTILRATYSRRQLFEVMVSFWTDHLNINLEKGDCIYLKPSDDRLVIRKYALGRFRDLIRASATSPAMLVYLDGDQNIKARPEDIPNENYARELLELHTLGINGGYTQKDISEIARGLTGWRVGSNWHRGEVYFDAKLHDDGEKFVLSHKISSGGGAADLDTIIDIVCEHPSTARHIANKLVHRFVSEETPQALVTRVAAEFQRTNGDIKSLVRLILNSEEFENSKGGRVKRPFQFIVSALRGLGADTHVHQSLIEFLMRMGQGPFEYPTPDGYPDKAESWMGTLLWRWNFAIALATNQIPNVDIALPRLATALSAANDAEFAERLFTHLVGRRPRVEETKAFDRLLSVSEPNPSDIGATDNRAEVASLVLAAPAFQRY